MTAYLPIFFYYLHLPIYEILILDDTASCKKKEKEKKKQTSRICLLIHRKKKKKTMFEQKLNFIYLQTFTKASNTLSLQSSQHWLQ